MAETPRAAPTKILLTGAAAISAVAGATAFVLTRSNNETPSAEDAMRGYVEAVRTQDCDAEMRHHSSRTLRGFPLDRWIEACNREWQGVSDDEITEVRSHRITEVRTLEEVTDEDGTPRADVRIITTDPQGVDESYTTTLVLEDDRWVLEHVSPVGEEVVSDL